ncbi:MAG: hypothetical protein IV107_18910 [Paucibacter sp.]|nr:hypothetical protein [Roseateles sp.]
MKQFIFSAFIFFSASASSAVNCVGLPQAVKVGEFGAQEGYLIVTINNLDYRLGPVDDPSAKVRVVIALTAIANNKPLVLRFWDPHSDCNSVSFNRVVPNSTQVLQ